MKKRIVFIIILITVVYLLSLIYSKSNLSDIDNKNINSDYSFSNDRRLLSTHFYDDLRFKTSLDISTQKAVPTEKIYGGIVNHHLTADGLIAEFFKSISVSQPDILIVVGPNHSGYGVKTVHTASWNWATPFGILEANTEITGFLIKNNLAGNNFELMENEHSIAALVPYIKYFMPYTEIVPIILSSSAEKKDVIELAENTLNKIKNKNYMVISSVDFSHYLSLDEADKRDSITKEALLNRDINLISNMTNDYMDSPASIIFLLTIMNEVNAMNEAILNQNNSARILGIDSNSTTSYFVVVYY